MTKIEAMLNGEQKKKVTIRRGSRKETLRYISTEVLSGQRRAEAELQATYRMLIRDVTQDCILCGELAVDVLDRDMWISDEPLGVPYEF